MAVLVDRQALLCTRDRISMLSIFGMKFAATLAVDGVCCGGSIDGE